MKTFLQTKKGLDYSWDKSQFEDYDFQSPALFRSDAQQTQEIVASVLALDEVSQASKTGKGFLSVKLSFEKLPQLLHEMLLFHLGQIKQTKPNTIVLDYGGMNMAKQLHVGHIRSMFIGDCLGKIYEAQGHTVVRQNHVGDVGSQFGFLLQYLWEHPQPFSTNNELTDIYKTARVLYDSDEEFKNRSDERATLLQQGDEQTLLLWQKLKKVSDENMESFFRFFDVKLNTSHTKGESFYLKYCQDVVDDLIKKNLAQRDDDGSVVAFKDSKHPFVLQKSTGAFLYGLVDVVALKYRQEHYHPNTIVYVVDKRQKLHFEQVFSLAQQASYTQCVLEHKGFGTILGKDKKPLKTRSGDSVYLDELLEEGFSCYSQSVQGQKALAEDKGDLVARKTVLGALKYYDLHLRPQDDYVFDWEYVLSTTGQSAPYLQNTVVRIDSLIQKIDNSFVGLFDNIPKRHDDFLVQILDMGIKDSVLPKSAHGLVVQLAQSIEDVVLAQGGHQIVQSLLQLAKASHAFYETTRVLGHPQEKELTKLLKMVGCTQMYGMSLLGVSSYPGLSNRHLMKEEGAVRLGNVGLGKKGAKP